MIFVTIVVNAVQRDPIIVAALCTNVTFFINNLLIKFMAREHLKKTLYLPITHGAFSGWGEYMSLALPSAVILCAEWWMGEALVVFAGTLGVIYLATLVIIINMNNVVYDVSYGLSQAASSQIGRTLGELGKEAAKRLLKMIVLIQVIFCVFISIVFIFFSAELI